MNSICSVNTFFYKLETSVSSGWTEVPNLGGVILESLTTAIGGGKIMYYDSIEKKIYFTTTNDSFTTNQNMSWSMIPNTGRGYNLFGYDISAQTMFALTPPPTGSFSVSTYCDFITKIGSSLYVASTAFSSYIGVYNLSTLAWSSLSGFSVNGRVKSIAYNPSTNEIYLGGMFTSASTGNYLTRYNLTTGVQSTINCSGAGMLVSDMLFNTVNSYLYVGADTITNANTSGGVVASLSGNGICIYDSINGVWLNINLNIG
jgi:hypothetical protein